MGSGTREPSPSPAVLKARLLLPSCREGAGGAAEQPLPVLPPSVSSGKYSRNEELQGSLAALHGEATQQTKKRLKFYFSILLYFTFSRKFLHSSTNLTKSLKFRTNNPVTYYKHGFVGFFFFILKLVLGQLSFLQPSEEFISQHNF